jgi:hypothetical protein
MFFIRQSKEISREAGAFGRWTVMPTDQQTATNLRRLLSEAHALCRRAEELRLSEAETVALQRRYGAITAGAKVSFAFQGSLQRPIHDWLQRAELATRSVTRGDLAADAHVESLANQLRHLVDTANVAVLRPSRSHQAWAAFYSANEQAEQSAGSSGH